MRKIGITFFVLVCVAGSLFAGRRDIRFRHISLKDGLSQSGVPSILQDSKGFMWFGTQDGLNRYDGYTFKTYRPEAGNPNSLSGNYILSLLEDRRGVLWIGTLGAGLNKFDREKEEFTHFRFRPDDPTGLSHDIVNAIHEDRSGQLWFGTINGLNTFHRETGTFTHYRVIPGDPTSLGDNMIWVIYEDRSGTLWIGTSRGFNKFDRKTGTCVRYTGERGEPGNSQRPGDRMGNRISAIHEDGSGVFWIGTGNGLKRFDRETGKYTVSLEGKIITGIYEDRAGVLWIGTMGGGVSTFDRETEEFVHYRADPKNPTGLGSDRILTIYEDRSGSLWVGTDGKGINRFDRQTGKFRHYRNDPDDPDSLSHNDVYSFVEDRTGVLRVGTSGGGLDILDRETGRFTRYRPNPGKPGGPGGIFVLSICEDSTGALWFGTNGAGLHKWDRETGAISKYRGAPTDASGLSGNFVMTLYEDSTGTLWVGTLRSGLNKFDRETGTFTAYRFKPDVPGSLSSDIIYSIYDGRGDGDAGALWVGTRDAGLNKFDPQTEGFTHYRHNLNNPTGLSSDAVMCVYQDPSGSVWVGTYGGGLNKLDPEKETCTHYRERNGLPNDVVYGILPDETGCLWLSTNKGISKFDPRTETFKNYTVEDGLQSNEFNVGAYYKGKSGEMFFGGVNGFNAFYPHRVTDNKNIPPIVITDFQLFNKPVAGGADSPLKKHISETEEITLSYKQNVFSFNFVALNFIIPEKNRYKYKMEGIHDNWLDLGHKHDITFTGLEPGEYVLRIKGSNNDGVWNEEGTSLKIIITPPFWKTWWFRVLVVSVLLFLLFTWHRSRMKRLSLQLRTEKEMSRLFTKYNISEREQEILRLIMKGKSNKDIEDTLFISLPTVKSHIYRIYKKMKVKSRLELIRLVQQSVKME